MYSKVFLAMLVLATSIQAQNLNDYIYKNGLFGCQKTETTDTLLDNFVLMKVDSISKAETVHGVSSQLCVDQKYLFKELSCMVYYTFEDQYWPQFENLIPYYSLLFDKCDSTFYPFTGYGPGFSRIVKKYLPDIVTEGKTKVLELCLMYLYTSGRIPLLSIDNYEAIWDTTLYEEQKKYLEFTKKYIKKDIAAVSKTLIPNERFGLIVYLNSEIPFRLSVFTWEPESGDIEDWIFHVSETVFEVESSYHKLERMGPYKRREKDLFLGRGDKND